DARDRGVDPGEVHEQPDGDTDHHERGDERARATALQFPADPAEDQYERPGSRAIARKMSAGAITPPTAAIAGTSAFRGLSSSPWLSSWRSSMAARKKKTASRPSVTQCPSERSTTGTPLSGRR